jgi:sec-independent protein translocase protein TatB
VFDSIGWGEIIVLGLAALFIFGPERLPTLAKDAAAGLKKVRAAITGVREQVNESFGDELPELRDLDLRKYHPRTFIRSQLLDDDAPTVHRGSASPAAAPVARSRDRGTPPPFDVDAT